MKHTKRLISSIVFVVMNEGFKLLGEMLTVNLV